MRKVQFTGENGETEIGYFHEWGVNYEEFGTTTVNYTVAIVEKENGEITQICDDLNFKFLDIDNRSNDIEIRECEVWNLKQEKENFVGVGRFLKYIKNYAMVELETGKVVVIFASGVKFLKSYKK